jgi:hypothetical protein
MSDPETLNGLSEKFVAVESVIFVVDQVRRRLKTFFCRKTKDWCDSCVAILNIF